MDRPCARRRSGRVEAAEHSDHRREPDRAAGPARLAGGADAARGRLYRLGDLPQGRQVYGTLRGSRRHSHFPSSIADRGRRHGWLRDRVRFRAVLGVRAVRQGLLEGRLRCRAGMQSARSHLSCCRVLEVPVRQAFHLRPSRYQSRTLRSQVRPARFLPFAAARSRAHDLPHGRCFDRHQRHVSLDRHLAWRHGGRSRVRGALDSRSRPLPTDRAGPPRSRTGASISSAMSGSWAPRMASTS